MIHRGDRLLYPQRPLAVSRAPVGMQLGLVDKCITKYKLIGGYAEINLAMYTCISVIMLVMSLTGMGFNFVFSAWIYRHIHRESKKRVPP